MKGKSFVDTNVFVYASLEDDTHFAKRDKAISIIQAGEIVISTQVVNEFYVILLRNGINDVEIKKRTLEIVENTSLSIITLQTIEFAWEIREEHKCSYWDGLIIASALESKCNVLYSEDMHHGKMIEDMRIINPFA